MLARCSQETRQAYKGLVPKTRNTSRLTIHSALRGTSNV